MTEGIGFLNGLAMRWLRDTVFGDEVQLASRTDQDAYTAMEAMAEITGHTLSRSRLPELEYLADTLLE